jgi:hypothetical protein
MHRTNAGADPRTSDWMDRTNARTDDGPVMMGDHTATRPAYDRGATMPYRYGVYQWESGMQTGRMGQQRSRNSNRCICGEEQWNYQANSKPTKHHDFSSPIETSRREWKH